MNEAEQHTWGSNLAFLMAMIGAAVGLGNIWRFSYVLYSNGGGAFFIPYFCAIAIMGIPFLILEYGVGFHFKDSFSLILKKINSKLEIIGWMLSLMVFLVCCYYMVIVGWDIVYLISSFFKGWGSNPQGFFATYVGGSSNLTNIGNFMWPTFIAIIGVWIVLWYISHKSVDNGIGKISKILIPLLFVIMAIIVFYSFTLPGHMIGIEKLLQPNWSSLGNVNIWLAAFAQIIFSLSMGQAIAMTYAGYLDKKSKLSDNVLLVVASNSGFEIFTAFGVFSILGFMSFTSGMPIADLITEGTSLVFIVFPTIFNSMGLAGQILAPLLFLSILFAGITSGVGFFEPLAKSLADEFKWTRRKATTILAIIGLAISLCFTTGVGSYMVSIVDTFLNQFGILFLIAIQCIIFGWIYGIDIIIEIINRQSTFKIGKTWKFIIKFVLPIFLLGIWIKGIYDLILAATLFEAIVDMAIIIGVLIVSIILTYYQRDSDGFVDKNEV